MGSDARSVSTDALETLGTILTTPQGRDAIHLAVEPVTAGCAMQPSDDIVVVYVDGKGIAFNYAYVGGAPAGRKLGKGEGLGIADPFIKKDVIERGERFWFVMYPRQVRSLRHVWEHPAFPEGK